MKKNFNRIMIAIALFLGIWSILMVLSSTINTPELSDIYMKQAIAFAIGIILMLIMKRFPYTMLMEISPLLYAVAVLILSAVLVFGVEINGSRRWFDMGFIYFQPVEFAKLAVIMFLSVVLQRFSRTVYALIPVSVIMVLVIVQPDAGSSLMFVPIMVSMLLVSNIDTRWMNMLFPFILLFVISMFGESYLNVSGRTLIDIKYLIYPIILTAGAVFLYREMKTVKRDLNIFSLILVVMMLWISIGAGTGLAKTLRDYQKKRVVSFLIPELDPLGTGYNTRQSLLAVGSGRIMGKGIFEGTQTQLGFLPVRHTDFIFATVAEEMGFIGAIFMLILLFILMWQCIKLMERTEDTGGRLITAGIFGLILAQVTLNIGVTLGLLPVIGIQLPLVSYGGTGMIMFMMMIGILLNINNKTEIIGR